jgi:hypothetical protein
MDISYKYKDIIRPNIDAMIVVLKSILLSQCILELDVKKEMTKL